MPLTRSARRRTTRKVPTAATTIASRAANASAISQADREAHGPSLKPAPRTVWISGGRPSLRRSAPTYWSTMFVEPS